MTAKEYLSKAYRLNEKIESNLRLIERLRDMATNITVNLDEKVNGGKTGGRASTIEKIVDLQKKVNEEIDSLVDMFCEIRQTIESLCNEDEKLLLTLRYVEFMKWEEIAQKLSFSLTQVHRIHNRAIENIDVALKGKS